jgi:hypothetical protein
MELNTADALSKQFKLSKFYIRRLGQQGVLKEYRIGRAVRFDPSELLRVMQAQGEKRA